MFVVVDCCHCSVKEKGDKDQDGCPVQVVPCVAVYSSTLVDMCTAPPLVSRRPPWRRSGGPPSRGPRTEPRGHRHMLGQGTGTTTTTRGGDRTIPCRHRSSAPSTERVPVVLLGSGGGGSGPFLTPCNSMQGHHFRRKQHKMVAIRSSKRRKRIREYSLNNLQSVGFQCQSLSVLPRGKNVARRDQGTTNKK